MVLLLAELVELKEGPDEEGVVVSDSVVDREEVRLVTDVVPDSVGAMVVLTLYVLVEGGAVPPYELLV